MRNAHNPLSNHHHECVHKHTKHMNEIIGMNCAVSSAISEKCWRLILEEKKNEINYSRPL